MTFMKQILVVLSVLMLAASAHALLVDFIPQQASTVILEKDSSISLTYLVKNNDYLKQCVSFQTDKNTSFLKLSTSDKDLCLNAFESQSLTFNIRTTSDITDDEDYKATVLMTSLDGTFARNVTVTVGDNNFLDVRTFQKNICMQSLQDTVSVEIENISDLSLDLELQVDSPSLVAFIEDDQLNLHSNSTEFIDVTVNVNNTFKGNYDAQLMIMSNSFILLKTIPIKVIDCPPAIIPTFDLTLPKTKVDLNKSGNYFPVTFKLKNLLDEQQIVSIVADSRLPTKYNDVVLGPKETVTATFQVLPGKDIPAGTYEVQLYASVPGYSQQKTVSVKLFPESFIEVNAIEQYVNVPQNSTESMSIVFSNKGDYDESLTVLFNNTLTGIIPTLYNQVFTLKRGDSMSVRLDITATPQAFFGNQNLELKVIGKKTQIVPISFTVVEEEFVQVIGVIEISSYPKIITLSPNGNAVIPIVIRNTSSEELKDFSLRLIGLPAGQDFNVLIPTLSTLGPNEIRTVQMTVQAGPSVSNGQYPLVLEASTNKYKDIKDLQLLVEKAEDSDGSGSLLTGFFGFASSPPGFIALILIVAFLALAFYGLFIANNDDAALKEVKL